MLLFRTKKEFVGGCAILAKIIVFSKFSRRRFFTLMIFKFSKNEFYKRKHHRRCIDEIKNVKCKNAIL